MKNAITTFCFWKNSNIGRTPNHTNFISTKQYTTRIILIIFTQTDQYLIYEPNNTIITNLINTNTSKYKYNNTGVIIDIMIMYINFI